MMHSIIVSDSYYFPLSYGIITAFHTVLYYTHTVFHSREWSILYSTLMCCYMWNCICTCSDVTYTCKNAIHTCSDACSIYNTDTQNSVGICAFTTITVLWLLMML